MDARTNKPNEEAKKLDDIRKERLKETFGKRKQSKDSQESKENSKEQSPESEEKVEKSEKKLDIDEKNSYINDKNTSEEPTDKEVDEEVQRYKKIFEDQFGADGVKAAKSWSQTQSEYMKLRNKLRDNESKLDKLEELLEQNPQLANALERASKGEDVGSFEEIEQEPKGKSEQSTEQSKPDATNIDDVSEKQLIDSGYLNPDQKQFLDDSQWESLVRQASMNYMMRELPRKIAEEAVRETKKQTEEAERKRRLEEEREQNQNLISKRYNKGVDNVVAKYGFDFANNEQHQQLLDEIDSLVVGIRDPKNPKVIHEDAVEIAARHIAERHGIGVQKSTKPSKEDIENKTFESTGFNTQTRDGNVRREVGTDTIADKLRRKKLEHYEKQIEMRQRGRQKE